MAVGWQGYAAALGASEAMPSALVLEFSIHEGGSTDDIVRIIGASGVGVAAQLLHCAHAVGDRVIVPLCRGHRQQDHVGAGQGRGGEPHPLVWRPQGLPIMPPPRHCPRVRQLSNMLLCRQWWAATPTATQCCRWRRCAARTCWSTSLSRAMVIMTPPTLRQQAATVIGLHRSGQGGRDGQEHVHRRGGE